MQFEIEGLDTNLLDQDLKLKLKLMLRTNLSRRQSYFNCQVSEKFLAGQHLTIFAKPQEKQSPTEEALEV